MGYIAVGYAFGIVSALIGYYLFKKYRGKVARALSVVFGLIGGFVIIYSIVVTIVMITEHRGY